MGFEFSDKNREIQIHNYHELTGVYLSSNVLLIEANTGLPALGTVEAIPFHGLNQVAVFKVDKWEILEDNRGPIWDIETKELSELAELGVIPDRKTKLEPGAFDNWDGAKWVLDTTKQLEDAQLTAFSGIREFATQCRQSIAGNPDHLETAEWSEKRLRAIRISNNQSLPGDREKIETEALYREKGESVDQLVTKILAKANRFEHASIIITGMTSAAIVAVNNATTQIDLESLIETLKDRAQTELAKL